MFAKLGLLVSVVSLSAAGMVMSASTSPAPKAIASCCASCPHCADVCTGDCEVCGCASCTAN